MFSRAPGQENGEAASIRVQWFATVACKITSFYTNCETCSDASSPLIMTRDNICNVQQSSSVFSQNCKENKNSSQGIEQPNTVFKETVQYYFQSFIKISCMHNMLLWNLLRFVPLTIVLFVHTIQNVLGCLLICLSSCRWERGSSQEEAPVERAILWHVCSRSMFLRFRSNPMQSSSILEIVFCELQQQQPKTKKVDDRNKSLGANQHNCNLYSAACVTSAMKQFCFAPLVICTDATCKCAGNQCRCNVLEAHMKLKSPNLAGVQLPFHTR